MFRLLVVVLFLPLGGSLVRPSLPAPLNNPAQPSPAAVASAHAEPSRAAPPSPTAVASVPAQPSAAAHEEQVQGIEVSGPEEPILTTPNVAYECHTVGPNGLQAVASCNTQPIPR